MITKEEAKEIAINYIEERERPYTIVKEAYIEEDVEVIFGTYNEQKKDLYTVGYEDEGYDRPDLYFVIIEGHSGEVLYTMSEHGFVELMEED